MGHAAWLSPAFERYMVRDDGVLGIAHVAPRNHEGTSGDVELGLGVWSGDDGSGSYRERVWGGSKGGW